MNHRHRLVAIAVAVVFIVAILGVLRLPRALASFLDVSTTPHKVDYLMVLAGSYDRPLLAGALAQGGFAEQILITQVPGSALLTADGPLPFHEITASLLLWGGARADQITILPQPCATTYDEAMALRAFLEDRPQARITVVTSNFHTRRARFAFARVLRDTPHELTFVAAPTIDPGAWWHHERGLVSYAKEVAKLAFYWLRYGVVSASKPKV